MKKNIVAAKRYPVKIYFELGEDALDYPLNLTDKQVRILWEEVADEIIPSDVDVREVIQTEEDWDCVAQAAAERLFNYILDNKKLNCFVAEAIKE